MEAIILAGGKAERLGEAAGGRPKALVELAGRPLAAYQVEQLAAAGVTRVLVSCAAGEEGAFETALGGLGPEVNPLLRAATLPGSELVLPVLTNSYALRAGEAVSAAAGRLGLQFGHDVAEFARDKGGGKRDFALIVNESLVNECQEARQMVWIADITAESKPFNVSSWTVPEASGDFCARGGRFGSHSSNESMTPVYYGRVVFIAFFNAGVRALDVRDPYHPKEIGYFIPAVTDKTDKRCVGTGADQRCKTAIQTNNVEVDDRGYIYIVDRANTGMHILQLTGAARQAAKF